MKETPYTIRQAVPDDAKSYNAFRYRLASEPNNGITFHEGDYTATVEDTRQRIETRTQSPYHQILVAVDDKNRVIGECSTGGHSDRLSMRHNVGLGISVDQDYRRLGIGKALMQAMIAWVEANPELHRIELEVFHDNIRAINLYLKLGFVIEGRRRNAYRKHGTFKDAYIMSILFERENT